jgi:serine/threonine-protein kinase ULK/ATG1
MKSDDKIEPSTRERMRKDRKVACKMLTLRKINKTIRRYLLQEIEVMMSLRQERILNFLEAKKTSNNIYIFFEFCNGGDLRRLLELKGGKFDEKLAKEIIRQIAEGLVYLDQNKVMHRDLKLDNILIHFPDYKGEDSASDEYLKDFDIECDNIEVVIGDLGFAKALDAKDMTKSYCGTPLNMAPEIMNGKYYNTKVDIWSLGTMMYELLVGFSPFTGIDPHDLADRVNQGDYGVPKNIKLSLKCLEFLHKCLQFDPSKRLSHKDLLLHPFLEEDDESETINLSVSRGPGQMSFFDAPSSGFEIDDNNAVMFNVKESCLFNNHYQNAIKKFAAKQAKGEKVIQEPEVPEVPEANIADAEEVEGDEFDLIHESQHEEFKGMVMDINNQVKPMKSTKGSVLSEKPKSDQSHTKTSADAGSNEALLPQEEEKTEVKEEPVEEPTEKPSESSEKVDQISQQNDEKPEVQKEPESVQPKKEDLVQKLEEKEDVEEPQDDESESEEEDESAIDYTIVNFNGLEQIGEVSESLEKSTTIKKKKKAEPVPIPEEQEENNELDDSFEIVHHHDIRMVDSSYLIVDSQVA